MDSHISKVIKTKETSYRKNLIFEKYSQSNFSPLAFENNITQVAAVIHDALPKPFSQVFHHYVGHLWRNGSKFFTKSVLKWFEGLRLMFVKIAGGQIGRARGTPDIAS